MAIPTIFLLLTSVFFLMQVLPGDPIVIMYGEKFPTVYVDQIRHNLGLDRPIYEQYITYVGKLIRGDLGISLVYKIPVIEKIGQVYPVTLEVAFSGLLFATIVGVPLGIIAAVKRDGLFDQVSRLILLYIHSNPGFWIALLFQLFFGLYLGWFPISGRSPPSFSLQNITGLHIVDSILTLNFTAFRQTIKYLFLPCLTIGLTSLPTLSRLTRAAMLNVLGEDYMVTAKAKGLPDNVIIYKHGMRNGLLPVITSVGGTFTWLLGGTVIAEKIFALPGLGSLLMDSLLGRDFTMIQGIVAMYAIIVVVMNTIIDLIYALADPRIKY
ncbi:ABC transporter permease [Candidatus Bathyarchaeota archaeon]|nr:MAG: ABC transporter permease [Candidatus Bathyarchaeota archaeon]